MNSQRTSLPEFQLTTVTTSPFEPHRRSSTIQEDEALSRVRAHIERNIHRRILLAEAAEVAGFERTYFSAYFREKVGITFVRWLNAVRVARSIEILAVVPRVPIAEIARRVGYSDIRTYERNFIRMTGQPPSAWRAQFGPKPDSTKAKSASKTKRRS